MMRFARLASFSLLCTFVLACAGRRSSALLVIHDVTVVSATGAPPLQHATVIIGGGRIAAIGPAATTRVPRNATVVDGSGMYLVPGLIEMHAHLSKTRASALMLFLANGVTTVRDVGGEHAELVRWRNEIRRGVRSGPRLLIAGPYLESARNIARMRADPPESRIEPFERTRIGVASPADAHRIVDSLARLELDFLKIRTVQDQATFRALNEAADRNGLKLVGHVTGLPVELLLEAGHDGIEHFIYPVLDSLSRDQRMALWRRMRERGMAMVPTLVTMTNATFPTADSLRAIVQDSLGMLEPRRPYLSRFLVLDWREQVLEHDDRTRTLLMGLYPSVVRNLREMHEAGVPVLAGSDAAVLNIYPGSSLHEELALFVRDLGMTPTEALERSTAKSAEFLGIADSVGTVEVGKVADLLLLRDDPTANVEHLRSIEMMVVRGRLLRSPDIEQLLDSVRAAPDLRVNDWVR